MGDYKVRITPILQNRNTWFFGLTQILKNICLIYAFVYISSTQTNLLTNIEIVFSLLLTWLFLHRRPNRVDLLAMVFILIGCLVIVAGLPASVMVVATLWVFGGSLLTALRAIFAEVHPGNKKELSARERCAVTGWILLASSGAFIIFFVILSVIASWLPESTVAEAAEQCGFRDVHYFSRCFKAFHGISPGLYRRAPSRFVDVENFRSVGAAHPEPSSAES